MRSACILLATLLPAAGCGVGDLDGDGVPSLRDCNDRDPAQRLPAPMYVDSDLDGFGGPEVEIGCPGNSWLAANTGDCDDLDAAVLPGAAEVGCDGRDNDCDPSTVDGPAYTVGQTWPSVQAAIDVSAWNEAVHLCGSTIHEAVVVDRPLTIVGKGAGLTVLDGSGAATSTVEVRATLTLQGLTVTGGVGVPVDGERLGGGIAVPDCAGHTLSLVEVAVEGNTADRGGGIGVLGTACGEIYVTDSVVGGNRASEGGGVYFDADVSAFLLATVVEHNVAGRGGGLWLGDDLVVVKLASDVTVAGNEAVEGGGVWLGGATLHARSGSISSNVATHGGGVYGHGSVESAMIADNHAAEGGGLLARGVLAVGASTISGNTSDGDGGGASAPVGSALTLEHVHLLENVAAARGGGLHAVGTVSLVDVQVEAGVAARGGGISCVGCALVGEQIELRDTIALAAGGALDVGCGGVAELDASTLIGAGAPDGAAASIEGGSLVLRGSSYVTGCVADEGAAWLSVAAGCGSEGTLTLTDSDIEPGAPALALDGAPTPVPGASFTCTVQADGLAACTEP